jgi:hypothetical protein
MLTKKEMILETIAEKLDCYTDEEIENVSFSVIADNGEVLEVKMDFKHDLTLTSIPC